MTQPSVISRYFENVLLARLKEGLPFLQIILGPRQVGKSTGIAHILNSWEGPRYGVSADGATPKSSEWLKIEWQKAERLGPGTLFVVDEVQKIQSWAEVVKELYDPIRESRKLKVVLLGSASLSIQQGLAAALAGRFELIRASHWSFAEMQRAFDWDFDTYVSYGGYPGGALLVNSSERWRNFIIDSVIEPVLGRDIAGAVSIAKPALFRQLFEMAMGLPSQVVSYNKLLGQLQEGGNAATIKHYLQLLEGAFLIKLLPGFSKGAVRRHASSPKIVPLAPALSQAYRPQSIPEGDATWRGRILEAIVGAHLAKLPGKLFYWSDGDYELDFVREVDGTILAYEVKSARKRKARSTEEFLKKYPQSEIVTLEGEADIVHMLMKETEQGIA